MKRTAMVFALLFAAALPAMAQGRANGGGMKWLDEPTLAAAKELGTSVLAWARTDVLPQTQQWKNRLDAAMAPKAVACQVTCPPIVSSARAGPAIATNAALDPITAAARSNSAWVPYIPFRLTACDQ